MTLYLILGIGFLLLTVVWNIGKAIATSTAVTCNKLQEAIAAIKDFQEAVEPLENIREDLNSLHGVIGGRLYLKDAHDTDFDGPTIQELL